MDNDDVLSFIACSRLKSARRRKRLRKKHAEKQLIQLDRKETVLYVRRRALPLVPLEQPYQKGWKRSFVLRDDVARSKAASFYVGLLTKINTVQYSNEKSFLSRKKKQRRKARGVREQYLARLSFREWNDPKLALTAKERALFHLKEIKSNDSKAVKYRYVFIEPWRYVTRIKPHYITHVKIKDAALEQTLTRLKNHVERNHLRCLIAKMKYGSYFGYRRDDLKDMNASPIKNVPLHRLLALAEDDEL